LVTASILLGTANCDQYRLAVHRPREGGTMRRARIFAVVLGLAVVFGACASGDDPTVEAPEETTEATADAGGASAGTTVELSNTDLGDVLVDAEGATLYVFLQDADGKSNCADACAQTWPPLEADGEPAGGEGIDSDELGTIERDDGTSQVTYHDRPLYTYSGDTESGDTKGQGVGGNWYVVGADGEPIED
jgi:predicted lipoprotein with Yx(FWY)xxD motif